MRRPADSRLEGSKAEASMLILHWCAGDVAILALQSRLEHTTTLAHALLLCPLRVENLLACHGHAVGRRSARSASSADSSAITLGPTPDLPCYVS